MALRIAPYLRPERSAIALLAALVLAGVGFEALMPWPLKLAVDRVLRAEPHPENSFRVLAGLAIALVVIFAAGQLVQLLRTRVQAGLSGRMQYALAARLFAHLQSLSLAYHARTQKGDLVRRVALDSGCVPALVDAALSVLTALFTLGVLFAIMWRLDPALAALAGAIALPMGVLIRLLGPRMSKRAYHQQALEGEVWSLAEQTLTSLPLVQAFGREEHEGSRFRGASSRTMRAYMQTIASQLQFKFGVDGCIALGTAAVMLVGGWHVIAGTSSLGTLVVVLGYLTALYSPLVTLAYLSPTVAGALGSARRVAEALAIEERVDEVPGATALPRASAAGSRLVFERVSFGYEPGRPVLQDVSLEVRAGETVALVGATGAGKSTLVSLVPRLFDPWAGRVLIDGRDVREATLASVRAHVALVLQESFLLPVSIAENIAYGHPGASREAIVAAAVAANADEFIRRLPGGYDHVIGERGATLSGGERQRIAIARALLKDAPALILDEPTAALDAQNEALVMDAVERLMKGRSTIVIAHRFSTVRRADRILALASGRISEVRRLSSGGLKQ